MIQRKDGLLGLKPNNTASPTSSNIERHPVTGMLWVMQNLPTDLRRDVIEI